MENKIYLDVDIKPFPSTKKDKGYYIFIDRMKVGSANTINRSVLECKSKNYIEKIIKNFINTYTKEFDDGTKKVVRWNG